MAANPRPLRTPLPQNAFMDVPTPARPLAKCNACGAVYTVVLRETVANDAGSLQRWERFRSCFWCGAPGNGFLPATYRDAPLAATMKPIFLDRLPGE